MTRYDFVEARRWVKDYATTTGGAKAYVAHQLANVAPALLAAVDEQAEKIERRRIRLVEAENDLLNVRGILSPNGYPRRLPADVDLVPNVAPAVEWLADRVDELTAERNDVLHDLQVAVGKDYTTTPSAAIEAVRRIAVAESEIAALTAENARLRQKGNAQAAVVEAAKEWRDSDDIQLVGVDEIGEELVAAVDALKAAGR